jgi:excinuclease ABC subunit A
MFFKINEKKHELCDMDISDLTAWFQDLDKHLSDKQSVSQLK